MTRRLHVGLEGFTFPDLDPFALVDLAAESGYSHAAVRLIDPATNTPTFTTTEAHRLAAHARERGIILFGADILDLEGRKDDWVHCFSVAAACGITRISSFCRSAELTSSRARFRDLVAAGREHGVTPHIEPVSYFGVSSIADAAELIGHAGGGGITLDTLHFGRVGDDLGFLAHVADTIPIWLQVCDGPPPDELVPADATSDDRRARLRHESIASRLPPGDGICTVVDIVRTVRDNAPPQEHVLMVEAPDHDRVQRIGSAAYATICREAAEKVIAESAPRAVHV